MAASCATALQLRLWEMHSAGASNVHFCVGILAKWCGRRRKAYGYWHGEVRFELNGDLFV